VRDTMMRDERLHHAFRDGQLKHVGTLDDYAGMIRAALVLFEVTGEAGYLDAAERWATVLDAHYWDADGGGYFFTADDAEALIVRTKSAADHATPAGNGLMVSLLARLHFLTGKADYRARAEALVAAFSGEMAQNFFPLAALMNGVELLNCATQIVIVGDRDSADGRALLSAVFASCVPNRVLTVIAPDGALPDSHPARGKRQQDGRATAYVCVGTTCSLPLTEPDKLADAL